jgi:hypothetical protein
MIPIAGQLAGELSPYLTHRFIGSPFAFMASSDTPRSTSYLVRQLPFLLYHLFSFFNDKMIFLGCFHCNVVARSHRSAIHYVEVHVSLRDEMSGPDVKGERVMMGTEGHIRTYYDGVDMIRVFFGSNSWYKLMVGFGLAAFMHNLWSIQDLYFWFLLAANSRQVLAWMASMRLWESVINHK